MRLDTYIRGVDSIQLDLTLTVEDLPIDVDSLNDVSVEVIRFNGAIPLNTVYWLGTILTGEVVTTDSAAGEVSCYIDFTDTTTWPLTNFYVRVIKTITDANFDSGVKVESSIQEAFKLIRE